MADSGGMRLPNFKPAFEVLAGEAKGDGEKEEEEKEGGRGEEGAAGHGKNESAVVLEDASALDKVQTFFGLGSK